MSHVLGLVALPWALGLLFAVDGILSATGIPPGSDRPLALRAAVLVVAWAPGLLWWFSPALGQLTGFRWLLDKADISLALNDAGMEVRRAGDRLAVSWDEVSNAVVFDGWPPVAEFRLKSGARLVLPGEYVRARDEGGRETSLLAELVRHQPSVVQKGRPARQISLAVGLVVVAAGAVGVAVLLFR